MTGTNFQIIETMLFKREIEHLDLHLARLEKSAEHFNFIFNEPDISSAIQEVTDSLNPSISYKVRLLLSVDGKTEITTEIVDNLPESYRITISREKTESSNDFLYHKTTNRNFYNSELARARKNGFFDIIFMNEKDEITEGAITNIYIKNEGILITPPVSSGLLPGTIRTHLIQKKEVREELITLDDLFSAEEIYISNSLIGVQKINNHKELTIL